MPRSTTTSSDGAATPVELLAEDFLERKPPRRAADAPRVSRAVTPTWPTRSATCSLRS